MARTVKGRAAAFNTPNRFEQLHIEQMDEEFAQTNEKPAVQTVFYKDSTRSILARNESPDIPFTYSVNPYRGCEHGCIYCYARPSHEYLGFSAGLDFETRILVKMEAPLLLARAFSRKSWIPQMVALSGNTDPYQPVERSLELTRRCLEIFLQFRNPVSIVTKNALIVRDIGFLQEMAALDLVHVMISITSLDRELLGAMEPRASAPDQRLQAIERLASGGIPVGVNAAPIVPGLTDEELPDILKAASDHGAATASYMLVKLPGPVQQLFLEWVRRTVPLRADRILNRIRDTRSGFLNDPRFCTRMTGEGEIAGMIARLFDIHTRKLGLSHEWQDLSTKQFRRTRAEQLDLF